MRLTLLLLLLALVSPALAADPGRCTTYEEKTLGRWQTLCDDGTRAVSRWNQILDRWETRVTPPRPVVKPQRDPPPPAPRR